MLLPPLQAAVRGALSAALRGSGGSKRLLALPKSFELLRFTFAVGAPDDSGDGRTPAWLLRVEPAIISGGGSASCSTACVVAAEVDSSRAAMLEGILLGLAVATGVGSSPAAAAGGGGGGAGGFECVWWVRQPPRS